MKIFMYLFYSAKIAVKVNQTKKARRCEPSLFTYKPNKLFYGHESIKM